MNWYKMRTFKKEYVIYNQCLIKFDEEFTYENSKLAINEFLTGIYKKVGLVYGGVYHQNTEHKIDFKENVTHAITNIKLNKKGLYGDIKFIKSVPSAKILINLIINDGFDIFEIMPRLEFTNNIIVNLYSFDIILKQNKNK